MGERKSSQWRWAGIFGERPPRKTLQLHRSRCRQQCLRRPPPWAAVANCRAKLESCRSSARGEQSGRRSGELECAGQWPPGSHLAMTIRACCFPVFLLVGLLGAVLVLSAPIGRAFCGRTPRPHARSAAGCAAVGARMTTGASRRRCSRAVRADGAATIMLRKPPPLFPHGPCAWCCDDYQRKPNVRVRPNCGPGYECVPACGSATGGGGS